MGCRFVLLEEVLGMIQLGKAMRVEQWPYKSGPSHLPSACAQGGRGPSLELSTAGCTAQVSSIQTQNPEELMFALQAVPLMGSLTTAWAS